MSLLDQFLFERNIIFDDTVVDDDNFAFAVGMRMGILFRWFSVRRPACVPETQRPVEGVLLQNFFQIGKLARASPQLNGSPVEDGDASGIISAIFKASQP